MIRSNVEPDKCTLACGYKWRARLGDLNHAQRGAYELLIEKRIESSFFF